MPNELLKAVLDDADAAVAYAQQVRKFHRRRTAKALPQRRLDIDAALERLKDAMKPLRSASGRFPYGPQTDEAEVSRNLIRAASAALQRERRKLWKMKRNE